MAVFNRPPLPRDALPGTVHDDDFTGVAIDFRSARRVRATTERFRLWITKGAVTEGSTWRTTFDPSVVCLHLMAAEDVGVGFGCAPRAMAEGDPGRLVLVMSGGAQGAPGLRPREAVVAGVVPDGVSRAWLEWEGTPVRGFSIRDNGFVVLTQRSINGIGLRIHGRIVHRPLRACQAC